MTEYKTEMGLAIDVLIAAMQNPDFPRNDVDKVVAYLQAVYQGIHSAQDRRSEELRDRYSPIRGSGEMD